MKTIFKALFLILGSLTLTACWGSTYSWNQKLTIIVQTPHGEVVGSSVSHASFLYGQMPMSGSEISGGYKGEAVVIKLSEKKYIFALFDDQRELARISNTFRDQVPENRDRALSAITHLKGARALSWNYPLLVTFDNVSDPKTMRQVLPNDLASALGQGYKLRTMTLEVTDEPETSGEVEKVLNWISTFKGNLGQNMNAQFDANVNNITRSSFIRSAL